LSSRPIERAFTIGATLVVKKSIVDDPGDSNHGCYRGVSVPRPRQVDLEARGHRFRGESPIVLATRARFSATSATGYITWRDKHFAKRWHTGDIFREYEAPILYAHGIFYRHLLDRRVKRERIYSALCGEAE
jgi:hypothetical protein